MLMIDQPQGDLEKTVGTGGAVCIMKMYNHRDAAVAAELIGKGYKFVVNQVTRQAGKTFTDSGGDSFGANTGSSSGPKQRPFGIGVHRPCRILAGTSGPGRAIGHRLTTSATLPGRAECTNSSSTRKRSSACRRPRSFWSTTPGKAAGWRWPTPTPASACSTVSLSPRVSGCPMPYWDGFRFHQLIELPRVEGSEDGDARPSDERSGLLAAALTGAHADLLATGERRSAWCSPRGCASRMTGGCGSCGSGPPVFPAGLWDAGRPDHAPGALPARRGRRRAVRAGTRPAC